MGNEKGFERHREGERGGMFLENKRVLVGKWSKTIGKERLVNYGGDSKGFFGRAEQAKERYKRRH